MVSANIILDTRYKKKGDLYPLKLRVIHNRKPFDVNLGYSIPVKDWDEKAQKVKTSSLVIENVTRFNALINKDKQKAQDILIRLQDEGKSFEFMLYPGGRHGWGGMKALHLRNEANKFWMRNFFGK